MRYALRSLLLLFIAWLPSSALSEPRWPANEFEWLRHDLSAGEAISIFRSSGDTIENKVIVASSESIVPVPATPSVVAQLLDRLDASIRSSFDQTQSLSFDIDAAEKLGSALLAGALKHGSKVETLVIVPEVEMLRGVPFHILATGKHLALEKHDVAIVSNSELLRKSLRSRQSPLGTLKGTPTHSDRLGRAIARNSYLNLEYMTVFSESATEAFVKENLSRTNLVLFAAHGLHDAKDPWSSYLLFRASGQNDGLLSAREIRALRAPPGLAFVNSCDLGRQLVFPDALLTAGFSTVIASFWQPTLKGPSSAIVAKIMGLISQGRGAARAVSQAQREMLAQLRRDKKSSESLHPAVWAPFVAIGNWR